MGMDTTNRRGWWRDPETLIDLHAYGGILLAGAGLAMIYVPAALVAVGAALFYLAVRRP